MAVIESAKRLIPVPLIECDCSYVGSQPAGQASPEQEVLSFHSEPAIHMRYV